MKQWGTKDSVAVVGNVTLTANSATATVTANAFAGLVVGQSLVIDGEKYAVVSVANATSATLYPAADATATVVGFNKQEAPRWLSPEQNVTQLVFLDSDEVAANRAIGARAPGWNLYRTWTASGNVARHNMESIVVMSSQTAVDSVDEGDTDDL